MEPTCTAILETHTRSSLYELQRAGVEVHLRTHNHAHPCLPTTPIRASGPPPRTLLSAALGAESAAAPWAPGCDLSSAKADGRLMAAADGAKPGGAVLPLAGVPLWVGLPGTQGHATLFVETQMLPWVRFQA
eukprot:1147317-Pelagomonas_calceolata.AAC.1